MEHRNHWQDSEWVDDQLSAMLSAPDWSPEPDRALEVLRRRRSASLVRKRRLAVFAAGTLGAALAIFAVPGARAFALECAGACISQTDSIARSVLAGFGFTNREAVQVRQKAPDFTLMDSEGRAVQLSSFRGSVVVLNFWATWCPPCLEEIPWFVDFQRRYSSRGFSVIGVSFDDAGWSVVRPFISKQRINYPIVIGGSEIATAYGGVESLPATVIIDREGRIASVHFGLAVKRELEVEVQSALKEP